MELVTVREIYRDTEKYFKSEDYSRRMASKRQRFKTFWIFSAA